MATSAFGVDHGEISKALRPAAGLGLLTQAGRSAPGAGGMLSRKAAGGAAATGHRAGAGAFKTSRAAAKTKGQRAGQQIAQGGLSQGRESANSGWSSKIAAHQAIGTPAKAAPVGMRGSMQVRKPNKTFL